MKNFYSPIFVVLRIVIYALLLFGVAEAIFFDAAHPMEDGYFGEITLTEIGQELILFVLFVFYFVLSRKQPGIKAVSLLVSLFFLASFIREFNFLVENWLYLVLPVFTGFLWVLIKNFRKLEEQLQRFFSIPASTWLVAGVLVTFVFSRLFGRSKFWRLLYHDDTYRLAKAATEEGIELLGNSLMLIGTIEFILYFLYSKSAGNEKN
jgi:hypothetical protein